MSRITPNIKSYFPYIAQIDNAPYEVRPSFVPKTYMRPVTLKETNLLV